MLGCIETPRRNRRGVLFWDGDSLRFEFTVVVFSVLAFSLRGLCSFASVADLAVTKTERNNGRRENGKLKT